MSQQLRLAGFIVETEYTGRGLKGQFKQADRLNAKFTAVLNSESLDNNEVKIKNNKTKNEDIISLDVLLYYLDEQLAEMEADDECGCACQDDVECHCHDEECGCSHEEEQECCGKHHEATHKCECHHKED